MPAGLLLHRNLVRARFDEDGRIRVRIGDHEMQIEGEPRDPPDRLDDRRPQRQVRNKVPVHDIDVQHGRAGPFHPFNFIGQMGKVGGEDRRNNLNHLEETT